MSFYNYAQGKQRIIDILDSKTDIEKSTNIPKSDEEFTYENGIKAWVGALFVDIRNSSDYFTENKPDIVARVIRAFCSEIITILSKNDSYRQIGIRGDCVYAIYSCPTKAELESIMEDAIWINTFQKMFKKILSKKGFPTFSYGIGLGLSEDLIVKAGKKGTGINDLVWIGDAVVDAANMSSIGNKDGFDPIVMDSCFYGNIKDLAVTSENKYGDWIYEKYSYTLKKTVYHGTIIKTAFNDWIEEKL
ncbi:MAG: adenylate cyclase [Clostridia bacterium]|nr:adenylate cyclase [Clostridia bacterium]